jgi:hypothetical protein
MQLPSSRPGTRCDLIEAMDALDWQAILERHPGWHWSGSQAGLHCPGKAVLPLIRIEHIKDQRIRARFEAPAGACSSCSVREGCIQSDDPQYRKDVRLSLPAMHAPSLRQMWLNLSRSQRRGPFSKRSAGPPPSPNRPIWRLKPLGWEHPALPQQRPSLAVMPPTLLPAELRKSTRRAVQPIEVHVRRILAPVHVPHRALAQSAAERQRRRLSWSERLRWNALPAGSTVEISLRGASVIAELLDCSPFAPHVTNTASLHRI